MLAQASKSTKPVSAMSTYTGLLNMRPAKLSPRRPSSTGFGSVLMALAKMVARVASASWTLSAACAAYCSRRGLIRPKTLTHQVSLSLSRLDKRTELVANVPRCTCFGRLPAPLEPFVTPRAPHRLSIQTIPASDSNAASRT